MSMPKASALSSVSQPNVEDHEQKEKLSLIFETYKDKCATFPKEKGWISEILSLYQGFWYNSKKIMSVETVMAAQDTFQAHPNDIYLATLPKAGTTWLKALTFATVNRNQYKKDSISTHPLLMSNPHDCLPYIETETFSATPTYVDAHSQRLFATHIPYTSLPKSIIDCSCRLVYMSRNPKDVLVSFFHFANKLRDKSQGLLTFKETFEMFSKGVMPYGPYWDHVIGYYKLGLEDPTRILFLTYEEMKMDPVANLRRLAEFLHCPFTEEEETEGVVEEILRLCSFENLRDVNQHAKVDNKSILHDALFREGKVGDWSKYLTVEMSQILDEITKEKFQNLDISF